MNNSHLNTKIDIHRGPTVARLGLELKTEGCFTLHTPALIVGTSAITRLSFKINSFWRLKTREGPIFTVAAETVQN